MTPQSTLSHTSDDPSPTPRTTRLMPNVAAVAELCIDFAALLISALVITTRFLPNEDLAIAPSLTFSLFMVASMISLGLYTGRAERNTTGFYRLVAALVVGLFAIAVSSYLAPTISLPRDIALATTAIAFALIMLRRSVFAVTRKRPPRRILGVGSVDLATRVASRMRRASDLRGITIVGYVIEQTDNLPDEIREKVVRPASNLLEYVRAHRIDEIVLDAHGTSLASMQELLECKQAGIQFLSPESFFEKQMSRVEIDLLSQAEWLYVEPPSEPYLLWKRVFDVGMSCLLLLVAWPIMLMSAAAVVIDSRGGVFMRQERVGLNGSTFRLLKFRTMTLADSKITRVGRLLRLFRFDELPQIWNVLVGDMSVVGPRPERVEYVEQLAGTVPLYSQRCSVKPGLTGWAQLNYPYGASQRDAVEKLKYDLYYLKHASLTFDLAILLLTTEVVLWQKGP